jgi:hypothetical protein
MRGCIDKEHMHLYCRHVTGLSVCHGTLETKHQSPRHCPVIEVKEIFAYADTQTHLGSDRADAVKTVFHCCDDPFGKKPRVSSRSFVHVSCDKIRMQSANS